MCGINMILDFSRSVRSEHIQKMMDATKHRGTDASNFIHKPFGNSNIFLGSNRLKIIDRNKTSNQPFLSQDGKYALIFNGEIYNYEDLRNELISTGVQFKTFSDTEVLLHWLMYKGEKGIASLNGMFAFIFVDFNKDKIIIGRDPLGIKPLFVHKSNNQFIFSSEIKGILASSLVEKKLNEEAIPHYLAYKYAPRPATFYRGIEEVMPNTIWRIDSSDKSEKREIPSNSSEAPEEIGQLLIDSVIQQYSAPNNTGIMLSGGVDSTLLLAILNKELGYRNIPVFSIITKGGNKFATQDSAFSLKAAKHYEAEYNEVEIDQSSLNSLEEYVNTLGQPIADSGGFLTWLIAQKANGKSKVLLSGAGADELFAGYNRHYAFYNYLKYRGKNWFGLLKQGKKLPSLSPYISRFKKLAHSIDTSSSTTFNNFIQSDTFRTKNSLWDNHLSNEAQLRNALEHDQLNYLGADVLAITDQATMQHSIEARVPYLDHKIVQLTRNLSAKRLFEHGPKWMLKEQLITYGGKPFANRKKQGLGLPMDDWLRNDRFWEFNKFDNLIHQFVAADEINKLVSKHASGKENLTQELWRILLLHKWLNHNFT